MAEEAKSGLFVFGVRHFVEEMEVVKVEGGVGIGVGVRGWY